jgi:hypothetical protein
MYSRLWTSSVALFHSFVNGFLKSEGLGMTIFARSFKDGRGSFKTLLSVF